MKKKPIKGRGGVRPGAGRKALDPSVRRSALLQCSVTEAEAESICGAAQARGLSVSDYLRIRALGQKLPGIIGD